MATFVMETAEDALSSLYNRASEVMGIDSKKLFSRTRKQYVSRTRFVVFFVMLECGFSKKQIGIASGFDRASLVYAEKQIKQVLTGGDPDVMNLIFELRDVLDWADEGEVI